LEQEAEEMKKNQAALERDADVKKALTDAFSPAKTGVASDEELEQHELINIFGEALGEAQKAQENLVLSKISDLVKDQDSKIDAIRKTVLELITGLSVKSARDSFSDFNDVQDDVQKIMSSSYLNAEDSYLLHKARLARRSSGSSPETERPGRPPSIGSRDLYVQRGSDFEEDEGSSRVPPSPRQVFRDAVSNAIDKTLANRQR